MNDEMKEFLIDKNDIRSVHERHRRLLDLIAFLFHLLRMKRNDRAKQQSHSPSRMDFTTLDRSYQTVLRQLEQWHEQSTHELEQIYQKILTDLDKSFELVEKFLQLSRIVLVEQERQLSQVTTEREIDTIEQRIDVILGEIQNLERE